MSAAVPPLRDDICQVWWASLADHRPALTGLLDEAERGRLAALAQPADQVRFTLGAALIRHLAGHLLGADPAAVALRRDCADCGRPHGKVTVAVPGAPQFSLSHAGDRVAVAVHPSAAVGVDVEATGRVPEVLRLARLALSPAERAVLTGLDPAAQEEAFIQYWARKEAVVKATGEGLRTPLDTVEVSAPGDPARLLAGPLDPAGVQLADLAPGPGYAAAVAVLTIRPVAVVEFPAGPLLSG